MVQCRLVRSSYWRQCPGQSFLEHTIYCKREKGESVEDLLRALGEAKKDVKKINETRDPHFLAGGVPHGALVSADPSDIVTAAGKYGDSQVRHMPGGPAFLGLYRKFIAGSGWKPTHHAGPSSVCPSECDSKGLRGYVIYVYVDYFRLRGADPGEPVGFIIKLVEHYWCEKKGHKGRDTGPVEDPTKKPEKKTKTPRTSVSVRIKISRALCPPKGVGSIHVLVSVKTNAPVNKQKLAWAAAKDALKQIFGAGNAKEQLTQPLCTPGPCEVIWQDGTAGGGDPPTNPPPLPAQPDGAIDRGTSADYGWVILFECVSGANEQEREPGGGTRDGHGGDRRNRIGDILATPLAPEPRGVAFPEFANGAVENRQWIPYWDSDELGSYRISEEPVELMPRASDDRYV